MPSNASAAETSLFQFSTDALPERDRLAIWREQFGRQVARYEFEPLDHPVRGKVTARTAPRLGLVSVDHSPMRVARTRELLGDGDDALVLQVSMTGSFISHLGREFETNPGDAMLGSNADTGTFLSPSTASKCVLLNLSRRELRPLLDDFGTALARRVPANTPALRLLMRYAGIFDEPTLSPELQHLAITHVYDLVALALGAKHEATKIANSRGVRAARLRAAKDYVLHNLGNHELSAVTVAVYLDVTPRYVHKLFETEEESFTEFVLARRLTRAHRMLTDPRFSALPIGTIALDAGFSDLSHFNRSFRRRFGCTPSDARAAAGRRLG